MLKVGKFTNNLFYMSRQQDEELIEELNAQIAKTGYRQTEIAKRIGRSQSWLNQVLKGHKPMSSDVRKGLLLALKDLKKMSFLGGNEDSGPLDAA